MRLGWLILAQRAVRRVLDAGKRWKKSDESGHAGTISMTTFICRHLGQGWGDACSHQALLVDYDVLNVQMWAA